MEAKNAAIAIDPLRSRFLPAFRAFVQRAMRDTNVTHIFVGGSFARGQLRLDSDLDFCVVRRRGTALRHETLRLKGIPMDVVTVTPAIARRELTAERRSFLRRFSHLLAGSMRVVGDTTFAPVIVRARRVASSPVPTLSWETLQAYAMYCTKQKTIMRVYLEKQEHLNFLLKLTDVVARCVQYYFELHRLPIPSWKQASAVIVHAPIRRALLAVLGASSDAARYRAFCQIADHLIIRTQQY